ncbi:hypothetical protein A2U01_0084783, partial [Trifolium medium]|nr:hypothetical protein [Trifolium medium]
TTTTTKQNTSSENTCSVPTKIERDHHNQEFATPAAQHHHHQELKTQLKLTTSEATGAEENAENL